jgi:ATP-dependent DNA helicase PIF1
MMLLPCLCLAMPRPLPTSQLPSPAVLPPPALQRSRLWRATTTLRLSINMRVQLLAGEDAAAQQAWADYQLRVGDGREGLDPEGRLLRVPDHMCSTTEDPADLLRDVFGDIAGDPAARDPARLCRRAVLAPKNDHVNSVNDLAMEQLPGEHTDYTSADSIPPGENAAIYPVEFLNSLQPQGMPAHKLRLKVGAPIMLLRNMNPALGLANGTRLIVTACRPRVIQASIATGEHAGRIVYIPRIPIQPTDNDLPFTFTRLQFPVRPAFAMTINKSQGQTMERVGIYLPTPCFSHGQLYVAMSRVGIPGGVKIMVLNGRKPSGPDGPGVYTDNIVYREVLQ